MLKIWNTKTLRKGINVKSYKWDTIGDSTYDDEDVIIVQGLSVDRNDYAIYWARQLQNL